MIGRPNEESRMNSSVDMVSSFYPPLHDKARPWPITTDTNTALQLAKLALLIKFSGAVQGLLRSLRLPDASDTPVNLVAHPGLFYHYPALQIFHHAVSGTRSGGHQF